MNVPVKLMIEYGVPAMLLYVALFVVARRTRRQRGAEGVGPAWNVRAAIAVPLCAGVIGGVVLAILR